MSNNPQPFFTVEAPHGVSVAVTVEDLTEHFGQEEMNAAIAAIVGGKLLEVARPHMPDEMRANLRTVE